MKTVKYIGPGDEVEIEVAPEFWQPVKHGGTVEVTDDLADSLCEQVDNWAPAKAPSKKSPTTSDEES